VGRGGKNGQPEPFTASLDETKLKTGAERANSKAIDSDLLIVRGTSSEKPSPGKNAGQSRFGLEEKERGRARVVSLSSSYLWGYKKGEKKEEERKEGGFKGP